MHFSPLHATYLANLILLDFVTVILFGGIGWALRYNPEGRAFDFRFNPSSRTVALGLTRPLTEMNTSDFPWG